MYRGENYPFAARKVSVRSLTQYRLPTRCQKTQRSKGPHAPGSMR